MLENQKWGFPSFPTLVRLISINPLVMKLSLCFTLCTLFQVSLFSQSISWQTLNEPGNGGRTNHVAINPANSDHILVSGDMLGLGYSDDGGKTWLPTFGFNSYELHGITFHPTNRDIVWVGSMSGPFKSEDGGLNWELKREGMDPIKQFSFSCPIERILFDPGDENHLLAFGGSKRDWNSNGAPRWNVVWESNDGGETWAQLSTVGIEQRPGVTSATYISENKIAVAARGQGLFISEDNGETWELSIQGLPSTPDVYHVAVDPQNAAILYASLNNILSGDEYVPGGIYKSMDGGQTWQNRSEGLQQTAHPNPNSASYYQTVLVAPSNSNILYTSNLGWWNAGVYKSTDAGETWAPILNMTSTNNFPPTYFDAAAPGFGALDIAADDPNVCIGAGSSKVMKTLDGGTTWEDLMSKPADQPGYFTGNGFCGLVCRNIEINPFDPAHAVLQSMDNGKFMHSNDNMQSWKRAGTGMSEYKGGNDVAFASANVIYCTTGQADFDGVWKSIDQGNSWEEFEIDAFPGADASARPFGIHTLPGNGDQVWVVLDNNVYYSSNGGANWESVLTAPGLNYIAGAANTPTTFYVMGDLGVYRTPNGTDFTLMPESPTGGEQIMCDPNNDAGVYLTKWRTNDGLEGLWKYDGQEWSRIREEFYAYGIAIQPGNSDVILLGTLDQPFHDIMNSTGVWLTTDGGETWTQQNEGLPLLRAAEVAFNPHDPTQVLTGTQGRGFFVGSLSTNVSTEKELGTSLTVSPNPASGMLHIEYSGLKAELEVVEISGKGVWSKGEVFFPYKLDIQTLPVGVYILSLTDSQSGLRVYKKIVKK